MALPYTFTNGTAADADELQANFDAVVARLSNIKNAAIAPAAAIDKSKLAQPYTVFDIVLPIIGIAGSVLAPGGTTGLFTINQDAMTTLDKHFRLPLRSGQAAWLCAVEWYVGRIGGIASGMPYLDLLVDGVQLAGQVIQVDTARDYYTISAPNPVDSPLMPISDLTIFNSRVGSSAGSPGSAAAGPSLADVTLRLTIKQEVVP